MMASMMGEQPTLLQVLEKNNPTCLRVALAHLDLPCDRIADQKFLRQVDVVMTDAGAPNLLCEKLRRHEGALRHREVLHLLCDAHKMFAVLTQSFSLIKPCWS